MDLHQLKAFICVAQMQHLTHAAEELNISQPALSGSISRLEKEIGVKLFDRVGRNIVLNNNGHLFLPFAINAVEQVDFGLSAIKSRIENIEQDVIICSTPMSSFPGLLDTILKISPNATIKTTTVSALELEQQLVSNEIDLCITTGNIKNPQIKSALLQEIELCIILSTNHSLAYTSELNISDISNEQFVSLSEEGFFFNSIQLLKKNAKFDPNIKFFVPSAKEMLEFLETGSCISVVPAKYAETLDPQKFKALNISNLPLKTTRKIYWRKDEDRSIVLNTKAAIRKYFK